MINKSNNISLLHFLLIIIAGFCVYSNSLAGEFVWDDQILIEDNIYLKNFCNTSKVFSDVGYLDVDKGYSYYRPLQILSYMADYSLWKFNVFGYHLTNIILHILTSIVLYWFILVIFKNKLTAFFTSILFVIHPIHTEAVAYISGRADSMGLMFMLLAFIFYIKYKSNNSKFTHISMLLSYLLSLCSRESTLIFPILILFYHYSFKEKFNLKTVFSIIGVVCLYFVLRLNALGFLVYEHMSGLFDRIPGAFVALGEYIRLLLIPFPLHMEYGNRSFNFCNIKVIIGILILAVLLTCLFKFKNSKKFYFFGIGWFLITFLPISNIFPINAYMAEHWLYAPSIGFFLITARGMNFVYSKLRFYNIGRILIFCIIGFYGFLTIAANSYWIDPVSFYERVLKFTPNNSIIYNNIGMLHNRRGKEEDAVSSFKKAISINPNFAQAYNNLAIIYWNKGERREALKLFQKAVILGCDYAKLYCNIAKAYYEFGEIEAAKIFYKKALEKIPHFKEACLSLGEILLKNNEYKEAERIFLQAIEIAPDYLEVYENLGVLYGKLGRYDDAIDLFKRALNIQPDYGIFHNNLAVAYYYKGDYDLADKHCNIAIELGVEVSSDFKNMVKP